MKKLILPILFIAGLIIASWTDLSYKIEYKNITQDELNEIKEKLIISEALVKKFAENDSIDIMQYVRDVKREMDVEIDE